ncbi:HAD hydrolase-like protein [Bombilactobacillus thymidiniphilus]|uniref:HAD hydrolase-like protein n=1 Tax=Bombilactobacillus thymidiniphilus TaxID=2923363 RepID=A0ABY4PB95_9LACO|nr:HAD hydrolase-like protein [Bombilactobacillus thymidiniphilus]UQS83043.1 HAD hydrolase-like protein [Bombilactobacillus thymidiniphilus]
MPKNIFFDLDGTIINSGTGITNALKYAFNREDLTIPPDYVLKKYIGPPLLESFAKYNDIAIGSDLSRNLLVDFQEYYGQTGWREMELYPQITTTLKKLKANNKRLFIATAKPQSFAVKIIDYLNLQKLFTRIYGSDLSETMSKADVIEHALEEENLHPENVVMVGDRSTDVLGAKANNVDTIGVLYGFGDRQELMEAGAIATVAQPRDLVKQVNL